MEMYKKPIMNIIEMENADVLTESGNCTICNTHYGNLATHESSQGHLDALAALESGSQG